MKNHRTFQQLSAFLALSLLLASCGGTEAGSDDTTAQDNTPVTTEDTNAVLYSDLPTGDFGGRTFTILVNSMDYALYQIDTDAQNGETFNDTVLLAYP